MFGNALQQRHLQDFSRLSPGTVLRGHVFVYMDFAARLLLTKPSATHSQCIGTDLDLELCKAILYSKAIQQQTRHHALSLTL